MDINIIASACSEINNRHIFNLLKDRDRSKNHIIIAPDRSQFSLEQRLFEETGEKCFFDVNIISLSRLARSVLTNNSRRILTKQSGVALVKKILDDNVDRLLAFKKATAHLGFASSLFETICFYKSCNISPLDVYVDDSDSLANLKQKDIKFVYTEYEKYLQTDYTDSFNQLQLFADNITKDTFPNTIFYFIEFDDFTRLMYGIIAKLARFSEGIYITCAYGKGSNNSNIYGNKVYYDLIDLFKGEGLDYSINKLESKDNPIQHHLANNLLAYKPNKLDLKDSNISIKSFENIKEEVKYTIADIYSHAMLSGSSFSDYTIVVPSLNDYRAILIEELSNYYIPYYIDESETLIDNRFIRLLFDICYIISTSDYKKSDFSVVIKSPLLAFNEDDICNYDNYLRKIGAVSDMCLRTSDEMGEELAQFISFIKKHRENVITLSTFAEYITVIEEIFDYINMRALAFINNLDSFENRVYLQVINKFNNINEDICNVFGNNHTSFTSFIDIYKSYFESTNISLPPIASNTLFIADFNVSYVSKVDNLYILGNNEGILPKMKLDNGLVTDEELSRLPNADRLSPTIAMLNNRKTFKLFELIFKYNKTLNISYLHLSVEGKLYPNNLVNSISSIGDIKVNNQSNVLDVISRSYNTLDINNVVFNNLTPKIAEKNVIDYISDWEIFNNNLNYRKIVSTLYNLSSNNTKNIIGRINSTSALQPLTTINFFKKGYSSISQIESYNMCPYLHFCRYGLRLQEDRENILKPNDIGTIIHEVLSKIVPVMLRDTDINYIQTLAKESMDKVLSKEDYADIVRNKSNNFMIKALYRELERIVVAVNNEIQMSNFKPKYYEYRFENFNVNGINIKGFIDRIDVCDEGFIIIDYKTGDNQFKNFNDVLSGKKLQLLMYAKAYAEKSGMMAMGAFYLPLSNAFGDDTSYRLNGVMLKSDSNIVNMDSGLSQENYKSNIVNLKTTSTGKIYDNSYYKNLCLRREDFDYLLDFAMKQVSKSIDNIRKGEVSPRPLVDKNKSVCDYCSYKALCNYNGDNANNIVTVENIDKLKQLGEGDGGI